MRYLFIGLMCLSAITHLRAASFDCGKARTPTEKLICSDARLSQSDERMAAAYATALRLAPRISPEEAQDLRRDQRAWLRELQNLCKDVPCLTGEYADRTKFLDYYAAHGNANSPNGTGTYKMLKAVTCIACFPGIAETQIVQSGTLEILQQPNGSVKFSLNVVNESNFALGAVDARGASPTGE
jgi:uncharacterized protein